MSDSDADSDVPDSKTAQKLCEEFATITDTDTACAQFFLQDRKWDLQTSVNAYFEYKNERDKKEEKEELEIISSGVKTETSVEEELPRRVKLISWNVDGLDEDNLKRRTKVVCNIINSERPDIVFLQEVITETKVYIENYLPDYECYAGSDQGYFTVTLLRKSIVNKESVEIIPFPTSLMDRNLLIIKAKIGNSCLVLLNTHLESTKDHAEERIKQLRKAFQKVLSQSKSDNVIFGGDLNLRDKEAEIVKIPDGVVDLWEATGKRPECKFTWDMMRNDNKIFPGRFRPRCRFDRLYMKKSDPASIDPVHFGLVGLERLKTCRRFPSDHWGLVVFFDFV